MNTIKGWEIKRFDEIGTIFSGSTPSTSIRSFWDGEIVWVTPNDLSKLNTPYLSDSGKRITEKGLNGCSAHLLPKGSLVISSRAPIGYLALPTVQFCTNQGCKTIKLKNAFHPEFTYYNVLFNINKVKSLGEGTTFAEISKTALSTVELAFPTSEPEQTKIAEILSTVDRAIEQTEALIAKQQRIKTGLMQDLLTRGIDEHGNLRSEQTHKLKDSPLGRIPVEWEVTTLGTAVGRNKGSVQTGPFGSQLHAEDYKEAGVPIITVEHLSQNRILHENLPLVSEDDYRRLVKYSLREGDLVFSRVGAIDRCSYVSKDEDGWLFSGRCLRVRSEEEINSRYLGYQLNYDKARNWILNNSVGTTMACLNTSILSMTPIVLPKQKEQAQVAKFLDSISEAISCELLRKSKLRSLKTALMQDLLTGKKRATSLLIETEVTSG